MIEDLVNLDSLELHLGEDFLIVCICIKLKHIVQTQLLHMRFVLLDLVLDPDHLVILMLVQFQPEFLNLLNPRLVSSFGL